MAKRRGVVLGLGALATGSGAVFASGAFDADALTGPSADLRVVADAGLRVRSARDSSESPIVGEETNPTALSSVDSSDWWLKTDGLTGNFSGKIDSLIDSPGTPTVAALEIDQNTNNDLGIQTAFSNRLDGEVSPLLEVTNNTSTDYDITINYATNKDGEDGDQIDSSGKNGYGDDVNALEDTGGEYTNSGDDEVSRQVVQAIYQFRVSGYDDSADRNSASGSGGALISPDPTTDDPADEGENIYTLNSSETVFITLDFNTDKADIDGDTNEEDLVGKINSAAGGNGFDDNSELDLLNNIYLTANENSA